MKLGRANIQKLGFNNLYKNNSEQKHYHLLGIAGIGMSGIARMLISRGDSVSGSDLVSNKLTQELKHLGVVIQTGHDVEWIEKSDYIVRSSAITEDNPELIAAKSIGKPIIGRAEMLSMLMESFYRIAIAGSHGKTTTSSLASTLLIQAGLDPSYVIGGVLHEQGTNAHLSQGKHIVIEADESDASFLHYQPDVAIVTNIDSDHLATYDNDIQKLEQAFLEFIHGVASDGLVIACIDDERLQRVINLADRPVKTYSVEGRDADYQATVNNISEGKSSFTVTRKDGSQFDAVFSMPGKHNVSNALSCIVLAEHLGIPFESLDKTLQTFKGVGRRFDTYPLEHMTVIDDYGHHPHEIAMTLQAARQNWLGKKLCLAFQPHRYTRTQQLFNEFVDVLKTVDELLLLDIYSANEPYIEGADSDALAEAIQATGHTSSVVRLHNQDELIDYAKTHYGHDEIVILQGAGSIGGMVKPFMEALRATE